jgi:hypothetical protein
MSKNPPFFRFFRFFRDFPPRFSPKKSSSTVKWRDGQKTCLSSIFSACPSLDFFPSRPLSSGGAEKRAKIRAWGDFCFYFFFCGGPDTLRITNPSPGVSHSSFFLKYPSLRLNLVTYFCYFFDKKRLKITLFPTLNA